MSRQGSIWLPLFLTFACRTTPSFQGVDISSGQSVTIEAGPMPDGRTFCGSYLSAQSGTMTFTKCDHEIEGAFAYQWCGCAVRGNVWGQAEGNLARLKWTEDASKCPHGWQARGTGYLFVGGKPQADRPVELFGHRRYVADVRSPRDGSYRVEIHDAGTWTAVGLMDGEIASPAVARCP